ncbi:TolB family protein [Nocardioides sp. R1-1]|uniref:TolB family protein n=1 Tax=Nocardioides sp. R1-1 TaxID=3383502 RepID=UPI0038D1A5CD
MRWTRVLTGVALACTGLVVVAPAPAHAASCSARNGLIAFTSDRGGVWAIYAMNPDGTGSTRLTDVTDDDHPAWSPDGTKIAFASARDTRN